VTAVLHTLAGAWHFEAVPILAALVAGGLYLRGARALEAPHRLSRSRLAAFAAGVGAILIALLSPLDDLAARLQWAHMVQHLLLVLVAAPLVVLSRPLGTAVLGLPARAREHLGRVLGARMAGGAAPTTAFGVGLVFTATLWTWHLPRFYDATLANQGVHDFEHVTFLAAGLLFWAPVAGRALWMPALGDVGRAAICFFGLVTSWMLAVYLGYNPSVLYSYVGGYGVTALADQQMAAGVMWIPGSVPFLIALTALLAHWFEADDRAGRADAVQRSGAPL